MNFKNPNHVFFRVDEREEGPRMERDGKGRGEGRGEVTSQCPSQPHWPLSHVAMPNIQRCRRIGKRGKISCLFVSGSGGAKQ